MNLSVNFHNVDHSNHLESYVKEKIDLIIEKKGSNLTRIDWTFFKENPKESRGKELFKSKVHVYGKMKKDFFIEKDSSDIYKTVDQVYKSLFQKITKEFN